MYTANEHLHRRWQHRSFSSLEPGRLFLLTPKTLHQQDDLLHCKQWPMHSHKKLAPSCELVKLHCSPRKFHSPPKAVKHKAVISFSVWPHEMRIPNNHGCHTLTALTSCQKPQLLQNYMFGCFKLFQNWPLMITRNDPIASLLQADVQLHSHNVGCQSAVSNNWTN